jgi:hypothetical protein
MYVNGPANVKPKYQTAIFKEMEKSEDKRPFPATLQQFEETTFQTEGKTLPSQ